MPFASNADQIFTVLAECFHTESLMGPMVFLGQENPSPPDPKTREGPFPKGRALVIFFWGEGEGGR